MFVRSAELQVAMGKLWAALVAASAPVYGEIPRLQASMTAATTNANAFCLIRFDLLGFGRLPRQGKTGKVGSGNVAFRRDLTDLLQFIEMRDVKRLDRALIDALQPEPVQTLSRDIDVVTHVREEFVGKRYPVADEIPDFRV